MAIQISGITVIDNSRNVTTNRITFPGTQSASSDPNTLDDYEEGIWTPTIATGSWTYTFTNGTYTKIGNVVICNAYVRWSANSSTGGDFRVTLPFIPFTNSYYRFCGSFGYLEGIDNIGNRQLTLSMVGGENFTTIVALLDNSTPDYIQNTNINASGQIQYTLTYQTDT